ncbi:MAG: ECF-type sigma factor [Planctomycetota bacterium JB042]
MAPRHARDVTALLRRIGSGEAEAEQALYALLWGELHRIASAHLGRHDGGHTLQPTALVNEAWLRLAPPDGADWRDREHFLSFASRVMRSVLVDHARRRLAEKRGGAAGAVPLDEASDVTVDAGERPVDLLALDDALSRLDADDPALARIVDLRFFGGLSMEEAARVQGVSLSTAERRWRLARIWLRERLGDAP